MRRFLVASSWRPHLSASARAFSSKRTEWGLRDLPQETIARQAELAGSSFEEAADEPAPDARDRHVQARWADIEAAIAKTELEFTNIKARNLDKPVGRFQAPTFATDSRSWNDTKKELFPTPLMAGKRAEHAAEESKQQAAEEDQDAETRRNFTNNNQRGSEPRMHHSVIHIRKTGKSTAGGKVYSFKALTVCGNGLGAAAFANGRGESPKEAIAASLARSERLLERRPLVLLSTDDTLTFDTKVKVRGTRLHIWPQSKKYDYIKANEAVAHVLRAFGIKRAGAKVLGSRNPLNVVNATVKALQQQDSLQNIALRRGLRLKEAQEAHRSEEYAAWVTRFEPGRGKKKVDLKKRIQHDLSLTPPTLSKDAASQ
eukprot:CAMPEP_0175943916 /NCGR_PEP_ID=MMETSP0108-20121206/25819_1 /TAXON_ID=195067 ORGANISM="Goniomonas pacifica, Strain CCMP1869" /NCGR_SAMPLE_ID=MMETSP0108 /ASSEMBLY_ACC=CAM_ASM_000204 /LENGTH=371 /DNA_ID=CAMNT_0017268935 /DNA_START=9 /DNA_END=1124 /DNA_ORIENTATION=-